MAIADVSDLELSYDHDLVVLLDTLGRIDLPQFLTDLKINQPDTYERIRKIMENDKYASKR